MTAVHLGWMEPKLMLVIYTCLFPVTQLKLDSTRSFPFVMFSLVLGLTLTHHIILMSVIGIFSNKWPFSDDAISPDIPLSPALQTVIHPLDFFVFRSV